MTNDGAHGYETHAHAFMRRRNATIGPSTVQRWASQLKPGAEVLELGCGHGIVSQVLIEAGHRVSVIDASPTLLGVFQDRFPNAPTECARAENCLLLDRKYHGIVAWGLLFLLDEPEQRFILTRAADALLPGGRLLFTSPEKAVSWHDSITELPSRSLGAAAYTTLLQDRGLTLLPDYMDQGDNFYLDAVKQPTHLSSSIGNAP